MRVWNTITPVLFLLFLHFTHPSISLHPLWLQEKSVKGAAAKIFIDLFSIFIYFPLSLLALLSPSEQTQQHLRHLYMSEALEGLNIYNTKPLFIICCAQEFYLCKQKKRREENVKAYVRTTASATARTDVAQIEP